MEAIRKKPQQPRDSLSFSLLLSLHSPGLGDKHQALHARKVESEPEDQSAADEGKGLGGYGRGNQKRGS